MQCFAGVRLNHLQWSELNQVKLGEGYYLPNSRGLRTVRALANRRLVTLNEGAGWATTKLGENAIALFIKANPAAFL